MKRMWVRVLVAAILLPGLGCTRPADPPPPPGATEPPLQTPVPTPPPPEPTVVEPPAAEEIADVREFAGFSRDESHFAYSVFSEGAGFHLLHVVTPEGRTVERLQLPDEPKVEQARRWLAANGFTSAEGTLAPALRERLRVEVGGGKVRVWLQAAAGAGERVLYEANPFTQIGGIGHPASATVGKVAPSGRRVAIRIQQTPVTEFGGTTLYVIVALDPGQEGGR
jgi:hypothetical protein